MSRYDALRAKDLPGVRGRPLLGDVLSVRTGGELHNNKLQQNSDNFSLCLRTDSLSVNRPTNQCKHHREDQVIDELREDERSWQMQRSHVNMSRIRLCCCFPGSLYKLMDPCSHSLCSRIGAIKLQSNTGVSYLRGTMIM